VVYGDYPRGISKQIDIVVYRTDYHPVFEIGGIKHFPVESVMAVIENKSSISSTKSLHNALQNIASVKALDRTNNGTNYLHIGGQGPLLRVNPNQFDHQVFGVIVTEKSLTQDTLKDRLLEYLRHAERKLWPNGYHDVRGFTAFYLKEVDTTPPQVTVKPQEATHLCITDADAPGAVPPLVQMAFALVNFVRISPLIDFKPTGYLNGQCGPGSWWSL